jgi:hypothetical protein
MKIDLIIPTSQMVEDENIEEFKEKMERVISNQLLKVIPQFVEKFVINHYSKIPIDLLIFSLKLLYSVFKFNSR